MKRIVYLLILCILCLSLAGCGKVYHGTDELIEKAREEIPISEADTAELRYAGMCGKGDRAITWFVSGDEYQAHYYLPMEVELLDGGADYVYVRTYKPISRGRDIAVLNWDGGYCFLVNNSECVEVEIYDNDGSRHLIPIEKDAYPYVFYWETIPSEYGFLDKDGNCIGG